MRTQGILKHRQFQQIEEVVNLLLADPGQPQK